MQKYTMTSNVTSNNGNGEPYYFFKTGSALSNFVPSKYLTQDQEYYTVEQGFAYEKARTFGDREVAQQILCETDPLNCVRMGRRVSGFCVATWDQLRIYFMYKHVRQKFLQNSSYKDTLLKTRDQILIYLSKSNRFWASGTNKPPKLTITTTSTTAGAMTRATEGSDMAIVLANLGENWLGKILMTVRSEFFQHINKLVPRKLDRLAYRYHTTEQPLQKFDPNGEVSWDQFVGEKIAQLLKLVNLPKTGTLVELGPGSVSKVGHGLQQYGFEGKVILVEPEAKSLETICQSYKKLVPKATLVAFHGTLDMWLAHHNENKDSCNVVDCVVGNHFIDDILIGKYIANICADSGHTLFTRDQFFEDHYDSADLGVTSKFWEEFAGDIDGRVKVVRETLTELKQIMRTASSAIWSCYDSFVFRDATAKHPPLHHAHVFSRRVLHELDSWALENGFCQIELAPDAVIQSPDYWSVLVKGKTV